MLWTQIYVRYPEKHKDIKERLMDIEPYLMLFGAVPLRPENEIILEPDGKTVQIRAYNDGAGAKIVLRDNGFEIVREVKHQE